MQLSKLISLHRLFFYFLLLFIIVATVDIFNIDKFLYKTICEAVLPVTGGPCTDFYDLPIWNVYLSLAMLAALYHVHGEIRISNTHLSRKNK